MNYIYDGTFDGFLTCVYHHWYTEKAEGIFQDGPYQLDLCRYAMTVETDAKKAARVLAAITKKISKWDAKRVYQAFCSNEAEKEIKLLRYIAYGFERGPKIRLMHGDPVVKAVEAAEYRVGYEVHRLCGLIRFEEVAETGGGNTLLYSEIEPDNDVLEFLAPHFADRFKCEPIIIHDLKRDKALFAFGRKWEVYAADGINNAGIEATECEQDYSALWKRYFDIMAIAERKNPGCQRRFMPVRYWKRLTEMKGNA